MSRLTLDCIGARPIPWPPRPSPLFVVARNWYSIRRRIKVIIPELIVSPEDIKITQNGCLHFSQEFSTSIGNAVIYQKNKHNQLLTCEVSRTQQFQPSKDVWKHRARRPILQAISSEPFPVASSIRDVGDRDEHSHFRQAAYCKIKIQFPEAIISSNDMDWDDLGCLKITGNAARRYTDVAVLWLSNNHPILKDYKALSASPSDDLIVDVNGKVEIVRHLLKSRNRVWVTGTVHGQIELDISKTEELDDARVAWFTVNHSHFLHQFCGGGITHAFWSEVGVLSIKKKLGTLLAFCEMADVFARTHRTKTQRYVDSCVILSIFSNKNARLHTHSMLTGVLIHLHCIQKGKLTEDCEQHFNQKNHHEEFWQRLLSACVQREVAEKTRCKTRNDNDELSLTEQSFQDDEQHSDFDTTERVPVSEENPTCRRPVVFLMEHRSTLPKDYVCSLSTMCSGCWENGGIPQSAKCAMRHLDYAKIVFAGSTSTAGIPLVSTTSETPNRGRLNSIPVNVGKARKRLSSSLQLDISDISCTAEECSDYEEVEVFYTPDSGSAADDHDSLSQYSLRSVSAYSQTTGGGRFSWIANNTVLQEAAASEASSYASISSYESAARQPYSCSSSENPGFSTSDISSDDNGVSEPVTPVNDNSLSMIIWIALRSLRRLFYLQT